MAAAYVLIDFENVQPKVFVRHGQPAVPVGLATALQALACEV